jgi:hypothetical protein
MLLIGLAVPLGRTMLPIRHHDGVRHYLEFAPFLCLWAAVGFATLLSWLRERWPWAGASPVQRLARIALSLGLAAGLLPGLLATVVTFPNGVAYFNVTVGGLSGAQDRGIYDATDYWGNSYWQGLVWINDHAETDATLVVPVGRQVVAAAAPVRLRPDVRLQLDPRAPLSAPLYVMTITRVSDRGYALVRWLTNHHAPVHTLTVQGGTILEIYRLERADDIARAQRLSARWAEVVFALGLWLRDQRPDLAFGPGGLRAQLAEMGLPAMIAWLKLELPPELDPLLAELSELEAESR